jgi:chromosome segregation protein
MKIRRIELCGFKSFIDRTVLHIDDQLTAVVGPNGCGKSNIVDAIRWAMGEQSAKALRGKTMDEVIFGGSESRPPASFAEVTLTFENVRGKGHPDYEDIAEIAITRRVDRDGVSDYLINGAPCRRRDVTELLLASGISPRSSMVEQGRMGLIVEARPEERRLLIEEAAGIAKFRLHRQVTQRKMEQVRQNLLRISDVVSEMKRNLGSLKRQVGKARRFTELREELIALELLVASHRYLELTAIGRRLEGDLDRTEAELSRLGSDLASHEQVIDEHRRRQREAEQLLDALQSRVYQLTMRVQQTESAIERLQNDLRQEIRSEQEAGLRTASLSRRLEEVGTELDRDKLARDTTAEDAGQLEIGLKDQEERLEATRRRRSEIEARINSLQQGILRASAAVAAGERALESLEARDREGQERTRELQLVLVDARKQTDERQTRIAELTEQLEELVKRARDLGATREEREAARRAIEAELQKAKKERNDAAAELNLTMSRLRSLEEIAARHENYGQGVRELLGRREVRDRTLAVVAEVLDIPSNLEPAVAAVLGDELQDLVVEDIGSAAAVAGVITREQLGRAAAVPALPRRVGLPDQAPDSGDVLGCLADLVGCERRHEPLVRQLLKGVVVVRDLATAERLWNDHGGELTYVTLEGEVVYPTGRVRAGRDEQGLALLQTKREIRRLKQRVEVLEQDHLTRADRVDEIRSDLNALNAAIETLVHDAHQGDIQVVQQQKELSLARGELERFRGERSRIEAELARIARSLDTTRQDRARVAEEIARAVSDRTLGQQALVEAQHDLDDARASQESALATFTEARVQFARTHERVETLEANVRRLHAENRDIRERLGQLDTERHRTAGAQGRIRGELFAARELLGSNIVEREAAHRELERAQLGLEDLRAEGAEREAQARRAQAERDGHRDRAEKLRLDHRETVTERRVLVERIVDARGVDLLEVIADFHTRPPASQAHVERIEELKREIDRLGPVSLTALTEHDELKVRYDETVAQQQDLEQSLNHLQNAIQRLNREGRRRFQECFDEINNHFQAVFPRLFQGGRARLVLTDEKDLLETGVEIVAQPPGKKLGRMELMSGGEKALTAASLIFAIFQASPSPFSILDEVDHPFDDANVRRFLALLREMAGDSQFVMITHSKLSMAAADVLYGVTMEEPGVSKIVSVRMIEHEDHEAAAA